MSLQIWFWIFMAAWLLFHGWRYRTDPTYPWPNSLIPFILFLILGWQIFGNPVK